MDPTISPMLTPVVQWGFAGFCAVLIAIIVWLIRQLLMVLKQNNDVIAANTLAISDVNKVAHEQMELSRRIYDRLLSRPCLREND